MGRARTRKPKVIQWENFFLQTLTMADSNDPAHVALLLGQIIEQATALGDSIYQEDGLLHYDLSTAGAAASLDGMVKKVRRAIQANVLAATANDPIYEDTQ